MSILMSKKERKQAQLKKNRLHEQLFQLVRLRRVDEERVRDLDEAKKPRPGEKSDSPVWSAKVATIRNRLDGKRRASKERWNRFAGTSDGGGRGL